jgi:hypothetical protein
MEEARRWFDSLPAASITLWNNLKEVFLAKWTMKIEVIQSLLKELEGIKQADSEIVKAFGDFKVREITLPDSAKPSS